jgi:hypothetical protein
MYESNGTQIYLPLLKQFGLELNYLRLVDGQSSRKFHPLAIVGRFLATPLLYDSRAFRQAYYIISFSTRYSFGL